MLAAFGEQLSILGVKWVPGSKTTIAVGTQIFVRIYDLSKDNFSPVYNVQSTASINDFTFTAPLNADFADTGEIVNRILVASDSGDLYSHELTLSEAKDKAS